MSYLATKEIPPDIQAAGFPWTIRTSEAWTTPAFRMPIILALRIFALNPSRNWVGGLSGIVGVEEHILSGSNYNAPLPKTPNWPADVPDPVREGLASLIVRVRNQMTGSVYEFGIPFKDRLDTTPATVTTDLLLMGAEFDRKARART